VSAGQSTVMLYSWEVKADMVDSTSGLNVWVAVKQRDPSLTRAIPERIANECHINLHALPFC